MDEWLLVANLAISCILLTILVVMLGTFINFWKQIAPLLEKVKSFGGQGAIPNVKQIISMGALKLMESIDFGKIAGGMFGGGGRKSQ